MEPSLKFIDIYRGRKSAWYSSNLVKARNGF